MARKKIVQSAASASEVSFNVAPEDHHLIKEIASRMQSMALRTGAKSIKFDLMSAEMDITACHANGNPLRLRELLAADDFNFAHDVFGIERHIDRETGKLKNSFSPRFSYRG